MIDIAIQILWLAIGIIVLGLVVWLVLYVIKMFIPVPATVEKAVWLIILILILIGALSILAGRGGSWFRLHAAHELPYHQIDTRHLQGVLSHAA